MTYLQKLITEGVSRGFAAQIATAMEKAGIDFAQELLADPEYRQNVRTLVREQTKRLVDELNAPAPAATRPPRKRKKTR